ncbi:hypothetical protein GCM10023184_43680 [Flaviaesturariibacter amylovorans]|uniref:Outer membrane protein beta-barrel domain-containing protein n=1 Tax=Flaviaesturariibacter amylovorans TaxID=1084520 RepID=A0ABP8HRU2_9BACT
MVLVFLLAAASAHSQAVSGRLVDPETGAPLAGATVALASIRDSAGATQTRTTDSAGRFRFTVPGRDSLRLRFNYVGYETLQRTLRVDSADVALGDVRLPRAARELTGVVINATAPPATQKADTVQFNASAFKVNPDATAEDLARKLPGITIENGQVKSNGENVQKVTIDGRELFGDDATAALRNLPAEVIDKIQVFDRLSDQAQLTGFDDGNTNRGINIVTKANMRNGQFGRLFAGAGTGENGSDLRYSAGGNTTFLKNNRRVSLVGNFNNINQQNFAQQDLLGVTANARSGGGNRGPGGGGRGQGGRPQGGGGQGGFGSNANFLVGQQAGINRTTAFGINFTDQWGPKLTVTGSYFFNNNRNNTEELSTTDYFSKASAFSQTRDTTTSTSSNTNHRINARIEWKIDSSNTLLIIPNLSFQLNETDRATNRFFNYNENDRTLEQRFNSNRTSSNRTGNNLNNTILYRHSFAKRGRTVSVNLTTSSNTRTGETFVSTADRLLYTGTTEDTSTQRYTDQNNDGWQVSASINYTEPVGKKGQLQLSYNPSVSRSNADQAAWGYDPVSKQYNLFLDSLSNKFENRTDAQNGGLSYRAGDRDRMFSIGVNYQHTRLRSDQSFPRVLTVDNSFSNVLPNAMLRYKLSARSALRFNYRAQVNTPSVTQLQGVVDPTNAPLFTVGNPELDPQYTHTLSSQYTFTNTQKGQLLVANVFLQAANNYISNGTFTPLRDSLVAGQVIQGGSQLTKPINLDGYRSLRTLLTYAFPVKAIKSNVNFNSGFTYNRLPGYINNTLNQANNYVYNLGTGISSNISQYVDFTVSYNTNFNQVRNNSSDKSTQDYNYFQHVLSAQLNLLSKNGWLLNSDVSNQYFSGYSNLPSQAYTLWNLAVGKKLGKERKADLRLSVFDLLGQNQSIVRNVTDFGIENQQTQVLQRYFMLTFTYNLRNFGTAAARAANRRNTGL